MIVLGLTGSVGMGKSATATMFREAGVPVFDADAAVHELYQSGAVAAVETAFPGTTRGGVVDRTKLRDRVMGDDAAVKRLEALVHPMVRARREAFLADARRAGHAIAVLDVPLLFETGGEAGVDGVVVVSAPEAVQKARVLARPGMTEALFSAILDRQVPDAEKRSRADHVVDTGHGFEAARAQVAALLARLRPLHGKGSAEG